jgi:TolA-binding protein
LPEEVEPAQPTESPPSAAPAKLPAPESAELALFRRAQALHLKHDPHAIEAWDAYLRVAPSSALAPEARYNRALGLVRASRFAEAKRALAPFAEGKYGAYRREEAQALLVRLPK